MLPKWFWPAAAVFLVLVAIAAMLATSPGADAAFAGLLAVVLWALLPVGALVFLVWLVVTLNRIARASEEQTRLLAAQLDHLRQYEP